MQFSALDGFAHQFASKHTALVGSVTELSNLGVIQLSFLKGFVFRKCANDIECDLRSNAFFTAAAVAEADVLNPADPQPFVAYWRLSDELKLLNAIDLGTVVHDVHRLRRKQGIQIRVSSPAWVSAFFIA
jgi:hypothetical protein